MPIAVRPMQASGRAGAGSPLGLPFGYRVRREEGPLILRRPDGSFVSSFVSSFAAKGADTFEVELAVWEDAD